MDNNHIQLNYVHLYKQFHIFFSLYTDYILDNRNNISILKKLFSNNFDISSPLFIKFIISLNHINSNRLNINRPLDYPIFIRSLLVIIDGDYYYKKFLKSEYIDKKTIDIFLYKCDNVFISKAIRITYNYQLKHYYKKFCILCNSKLYFSHVNTKKQYKKKINLIIKFSECYLSKSFLLSIPTVIFQEISKFLQVC